MGRGIDGLPCPVTQTNDGQEGTVAAFLTILFHPVP
jgi:hypothetical protein